MSIVTRKYQVGDRVRHTGGQVGDITKINTWTHSVIIDGQHWRFLGEIELVTYPFAVDERVKFRTVTMISHGKVMNLFTTRNGAQYAVIEEEFDLLPHVVPIADVEKP
ncbi:hypothetical protein ACRQ5Q_14905 [Bradyrhizobium sp. PMVTL-01]|uniref:hypothetical protein n=1 Tax=Bradyrhizobium sp. PMVTL-01 TaxID=3434999 RepID=UPI003F6F11D5